MSHEQPACPQQPACPEGFCHGDPRCRRYSAALANLREAVAGWESDRTSPAATSAGEPTQLRPVTVHGIVLDERQIEVRFWRSVCDAASAFCSVTGRVPAPHSSAPGTPIEPTLPRLLERISWTIESVHYVGSLAMYAHPARPMPPLAWLRSALHMLEVQREDLGALGRLELEAVLDRLLELGRQVAQQPAGELEARYAAQADG